jgi:predicted ATPase
MEKIAFVERQVELDKLTDCADQTLKGKGSTVFLAGEAGIGKTRLSLEFKNVAQRKGFMILKGQCLAESLIPLLPFREALRSGGLEHMALGGKPPKVLWLYLLTHDGRLISQCGRPVESFEEVTFSHMQKIIEKYGKTNESKASKSKWRRILHEASPELVGAVPLIGGMFQAAAGIARAKRRIDRYEKMESGEKLELKVEALSTFETLGKLIIEKIAINENIQKLNTNDYQFILENKKDLNFVTIIQGQENEAIRYEMRRVLSDITKGNFSLFYENSPDLGKVKGIIATLLKSGKYEGMDYTEKDPKIKQENLFDNILLGLQRESTRKPLLLILDDLQWSDPTTLSLLHYLSRNTKKNRILILGTYRPEDMVSVWGEKEHKLMSTLQLMSKEGLYETIMLSRLSKGDALVNAILGKHKLGNDFIASIQKEAEGNPFFTIELIILLQEEGQLSRDAKGVWTLKGSLDKIHIPTKVFDVISRRLSRLLKEQREMLEYASVIGEEFESKVVGEALEIKRITLLKNLAEIEKLHKLIHSKGSLYRFDHAKIREALYEEIPYELKQEYHRVVAETFEKLYSNEKNKLSDTLAYHYFKAKDPKVVEYSLMAGDRYKKEYANIEAMRSYKMALEGVEEGDERLSDILEKLAGVCFVVGEWDDALNYYYVAIELIEDEGDEKRLAEGYRNIGLVYKNRNDWKNAIAYFNKCLKISEKVADFERTADIFYHLGNVFDEKGDLDNAQKYYGKCMDIAVKLNDDSEKAEAYLGIGRVHARKSEYDKSVDAFKKAIDILEYNDDMDVLSKAYANLGATYNQIDVNEAIKYHKKSIELADKIRYLRIKGYGLMNISYSYIKKVELKTASNYLDEALKIFEKLGEKIPLSISYINYGSIFRLQKDWMKAEDYFKKALTMCKELDTSYNLGYVLFEYGVMNKEKGETTQAREQLIQAHEIFVNLQNNDMIKKVEDELKTLS